MTDDIIFYKKINFTNLFCPFCGEKQVTKQENLYTLLPIDKDGLIMPITGKKVNIMKCRNCDKTFSVNLEDYNESKMP
jgi:hypothetical protein